MHCLIFVRLSSSSFLTWFVCLSPFKRVVSLWMAFQMNLPPPQGSVCISIVKQLHCRLLGSIHSKSEKVCRTAFSVKKKIAEKVRKSGRHFWAIWGNCGPFWVIFGPLWIILGHSRAILDHFGPFWVIFGPLWATLGHFWPFLDHFVAFLDKFAESSNFFAGF